MWEVLLVWDSTRTLLEGELELVQLVLLLVRLRVIVGNVGDLRADLVRIFVAIRFVLSADAFFQAS